MKIRVPLILIVIALAMLTGACTGNAVTVASGWAGVATDEDTAYLAFNNHVHAINLDSGVERWRFPAEADAKITFYAAPALTDDGQLIVGGYDNVLYSLSTATGQVNWKFEGAEGRFVGSVLVAGETIYAPNANHRLYALGLDGKMAWATPFETGEPLWAQPVADPACDCIYLTSMDHKIYAVNAQTGRQIWATPDLGGAIVGTPALGEDGRLYAGTFASEMLALDAGTGEILWRFATQKWAWASPAIEGETLYFGDLSGTFYALDRQTGQVLWQLQPGGAIVGKPLVYESGIYFTTETGSLLSVTPEGATRWNLPFDLDLHAGPVAAGETILVASSDSEKLLIAVDSNGVQKWSFGIKK